jgi:hypothetical protein
MRPTPRAKEVRIMSEIVEDFGRAIWTASDPASAARACAAIVERRMSELEDALRRAILGGDNLLAELEAHQENTGELLDDEGQVVVECAWRDLAVARAALNPTREASRGTE